MGALNYYLFSQTATLRMSLLEARNARGQFWCLVCGNPLHIRDAKQGCDWNWKDAPEQFMIESQYWPAQHCLQHHLSFCCKSFRNPPDWHLNSLGLIPAIKELCPTPSSSRWESVIYVTLELRFYSDFWEKSVITTQCSINNFQVFHIIYLREECHTTQCSIYNFQVFYIRFLREECHSHSLQY